MTPETKAAMERLNMAANTPFVSGQHDDGTVVRVGDLALILSYIKENEWRPIEEAPKDGTPILVAVDCEHSKSKRAFVKWDRDRWCFAIQGLQIYLHCTPTHFRTLPEPPEGE